MESTADEEEMSGFPRRQSPFGLHLGWGGAAAHDGQWEYRRPHDPCCH
jgi:hypothetical protein